MEAAASVVQMTGGGGRLGMSTDMFLLPSSGPYTSPPGVIVTTGSPNAGVHQYAAATLTLLRRDAWVLPVLILSVLTMTLIMTFEVNISYFEYVIGNFLFYLLPRKNDTRINLSSSD